MRASFIHMADTHLGYEQYGLHDRFNDFSRSFWQVVEDAIIRRVDFVLIAGDLFHKRAIDAMTLIHAIRGLEELKRHRIPALAIEGNHDRSYYRDGTSWLQFLCYQGYLQLLAPVMQNGAPQLTLWQPERMLGAYVDMLGGAIRVYGLPWQGSATARSLESMAQALKEARAEEDTAGVQYRILMMHTGIDGLVARVQGLPLMSQFQTLQGSLNYLALGHVHKPYEFNNWIYNAGSTETCSAEEVQWQDRGYYYVEVDTETPFSTDPQYGDCYHRATRIATRRRPFLRHELRMDGITEPTALYTRLEEFCRREAPHYEQMELRPVVQIQLIGTLNFDTSALDQQQMEELVRATLKPLHVRIDNHANDRDYEPEAGELDGRDRSVWHELERHVFEDLIGADARYIPAREQWGTVLSDLKQMALTGDEPDTIARFLREQRTRLFATETQSSSVE